MYASSGPIAAVRQPRLSVACQHSRRHSGTNCSGGIATAYDRVFGGQHVGVEPHHLPFAASRGRYVATRRSAGSTIDSSLKSSFRWRVPSKCTARGTRRTAGRARRRRVRQHGLVVVAVRRRAVGGGGGRRGGSLPHDVRLDRGDRRVVARRGFCASSGVDPRCCARGRGRRAPADGARASAELHRRWCALRRRLQATGRRRR